MNIEDIDDLPKFVTEEYFATISVKNKTKALLVDIEKNIKSINFWRKVPFNKCVPQLKPKRNKDNIMLAEIYKLSINHYQKFPEFYKAPDQFNNKLEQYKKENINTLTGTVVDLHKDFIFMIKEEAIMTESLSNLRNVDYHLKIKAGASLALLTVAIGTTGWCIYGKNKV